MLCSIIEEMGRLIIIRGNSGSGKSTIANRLQHELGYGTMLVQQDILRREILRVKDGPNNPSIQLIYDTALYGKQIGYDVIVEGILNSKNYGEMLRKLVDNFDAVYVYYFNISFEETLRRHQTKPNSQDFGEEEMRRWYKEKDLLGYENEKIIDENQSENETFANIMRDLNL